LAMAPQSSTLTVRDAVFWWNETRHLYCNGVTLLLTAVPVTCLGAWRGAQSWGGLSGVWWKNCCAAAPAQ